MYEYEAVIEEVVDGDTFKLNVDLGFHLHIKITGRLLGIDTPEKFIEHKKNLDEKELGLICKEFARINFEGKTVIIQTSKPDNFGRTLCDIYWFENGARVNMLDFYNQLGFNKLNESYDPSKILKYKYLLEK